MTVSGSRGRPMGVAPQARVAVISTAYASGCMQGALGLLGYNKRMYAELNGYDYIAHVPSHFNQRYANWGKIDAMLAHAARYDWVAWLDIDAVVMNYATRVEDVVSLFPFATQLLTNKPPGDDMVNTGVVFARGSQWTRDFLNRTQHYAELYTRWPYEQGAIAQEGQKEIDAGTGRVVFYEGDDLFNSLCGYPDGSCHWTPGRFIAHFAPPACPAEDALQYAYRSVLSLPPRYAPLIVSGASSNHAGTSIGFLDSVARHAPGQRVLFWDLGLTRSERARIARHPAVSEVRTFDFARYPPHLRFDVDARSYAWKPALLNETLQDHELVLWLDAGDRLVKSPAPAWSRLLEDGLLSSETSGAYHTWVHPGMREYLRAYQPDQHLTEPMCNGAVVGMHKRSAAYGAVFKPWVDCAMDPRCITPEGSSRDNHRQDQAALTVLMSHFGVRCAKVDWVILHQDYRDD